MSVHRALAALLVAALACGGEEAEAPPPSIAVDTVPLLSIGVQEGEDPYQLHQVWDAYRHPDGRIVVSNAGSAELRIFDSSGTYIGALGRRGAGPGEFNELSSPMLHPRADQLLVSDDGAARLHVLDGALRFVETRRFTLTPENPRPFLRGVLADGDWVAMAFANGGTLRGEPGQVIRSTYAVLRYDSTGTLRDTITTLPGRPRIVNEHEGRVHFPYIPLSSEPLFGVDGDRLVVVSGFAPALEFRGADGTVLAQRTFPRAQVRAADIWAEYKASSARSMRGARDSARYAAFHEKALPLPEFAPLFVGLKVDAARRIWLERFRMPDDDGPRAWDVLDSTGTYLGMVLTPRGLTVYRIGTDALIGRSRDSLGVERVQLFRIR
jgi:hypothetical protein